MTAISHIGELKPDARNARKHNPRNIGMIANALNDVGAARSIVIDEAGNILAGNGTVEAAAQAGIERVRVVDADGEEIIAVRRSGLTAEQKQRLALYDNRTAELAAWEPEVLAEMASEIDTSMMFSAVELARALGTEDANDPVAEWAGMPEFDQQDQMAVFQLLVNFASLADVAKFSALIGQNINAEAGERRRSVWFPKVERQSRREMGYVGDES